MDNNLENMGFAGALAQSRSVQAVIRVLDLFATKHPGVCTFEFKREQAQGVEVNFGTSSLTGGTESGLSDLLRLLSCTEQLMMLEAMIASLRDRRVDPVLIESLVVEAEGLAKTLYASAAEKTGING